MNRRYLQFPEMLDEGTSYNNRLISLGKRIDADWSFEALILQNVFKMLHMYSFDIHKVDQGVFRGTRGKSGKFTVI
jgi:hypothetical protein